MSLIDTTKIVYLFQRDPYWYYPFRFGYLPMFYEPTSKDSGWVRAAAPTMLDFKQALTKRFVSRMDLPAYHEK